MWVSLKTITPPPLSSKDHFSPSKKTCFFKPKQELWLAKSILHRSISQEKLLWIPQTLFTRAGFQNENEVWMACLYRETPSSGFAQVHESKISSHFHCCIPQCVNHSRRDPKGSLFFHRFPRDKKLQQQWIVKMRRDTSPNFRVSIPSVQ